MTRLRRQMLEELERRNYTEGTIHVYLRAVEEYARYFETPPDRLGPEHIREYQAHLFRDRKLAANTRGATSDRTALLLLQDAQAQLGPGA